MRKGDLVWVPLSSAQALKTLHNPRYAGVFVRSQTRSRRMPDGKVKTRKVPQDQWSIVLPNCHAGYITWEEFQQNQRRLRENSAAHGGDRRKSPPREGPALLQGLVLCGRCGRPMTIRYRNRKGGIQPIYVCQRESVDHAEPVCQAIPGAKIDEAVGALLLEMVTPLSLEVALEVQDSLQTQFDEADRLRRQQVQRARYEADLAKHRFMQVDPEQPPGRRCLGGRLEREASRAQRRARELREAAAGGSRGPRREAAPGSAFADQRLPTPLARPTSIVPRAEADGPPADRGRHVGEG